MPDLGHVVDSDGLCTSLLWLPPEVWVREQGETRELESEGMNLVAIEEHQAGDLVFAQVYYLYILLEATSAMLLYQ